MRSTREVMLRNGQTWCISSDPGPPPGNDRWTACLLASTNELPFSVGDLAARAAIEGRCPTIVIVAPNAEAVHDYVDSIVEAKEAYDVLTTFDSGREALQDAVNAIFVSLGGNGPVYAFSDSPFLVERTLNIMGFMA